MTSAGGRSRRDRIAWRKVAGGVLLFGIAFVLLFVADGSRQPTSGPGWQILGYQRAVSGSAEIATIPTQDALDAAWARLLIRKPPPELPQNAVTFWITATGSLGCPAHFAGFEVNQAAHSVAAKFTFAMASGCDALRVPDSFLVAIDRDRLPSMPFRLLRTGPDARPDSAVEIGP